MTSKPSPTECFVYITLPGTTEPVTAARFELTVDRNGNPIGRLVYGKSYLDRADAVPIDPVELKLAARVYETTALRGVFGALRDAGPDYWGRLVIERHVGKAPLGELDYLLHSPDDRAGALGLSMLLAPIPRHMFTGPSEPVSLSCCFQCYLPCSCISTGDQLCGHLHGACRHFRKSSGAGQTGLLIEHRTRMTPSSL